MSDTSIGYAHISGIRAQFLSGAPVGTRSPLHILA
jgi:hypothetical protein